LVGLEGGKEIVHELSRNLGYPLISVVGSQPTAVLQRSLFACLTTAHAWLYVDEQDEVVMDRLVDDLKEIREELLRGGQQVKVRGDEGGEGSIQLQLPLRNSTLADKSFT